MVQSNSLALDDRREPPSEASQELDERASAELAELAGESMALRAVARRLWPSARRNGRAYSIVLDIAMRWGQVDARRAELEERVGV